MDRREQERIREFVEGKFDNLGLDWLVENLSLEELIRVSGTQQWAWDALLDRVRRYRDTKQEFTPALAQWTVAIALGELQPPTKPGPKPDVGHHIRVDAAVGWVRRHYGFDNDEEARAEVAAALGQADDTIKTASGNARKVWKAIEG